MDAAGKTTILYKLKLGEIVTTIPTIGTLSFSVPRSAVLFIPAPHSLMLSPFHCLIMSVVLESSVFWLWRFVRLLLLLNTNMEREREREREREERPDRIDAFFVALLGEEYKRRKKREKGGGGGERMTRDPSKKKLYTGNNDNKNNRPDTDR